MDYHFIIGVIRADMMDVGAIFLFLAEPFLIIAGILLLFDLYLLTKAKEDKHEDLSLFPAPIACMLIIGSYLILTYAFVSDVFSLREVYIYSSSGLSVLYKLGGPWISSNGSLLFITFLFALFYAGYHIKDAGRQGIFRKDCFKILDVFLLFFVVISLLRSPFASLPEVPSDGMGLNPLLQTFWVLIHPPVIFLGYVGVFFASAFVLAGMLRRDTPAQEVQDVMRLPTYGAWLFLAFGIGLGGWWSYEVLGWGGYWSWDPVETASLLPWLALTAYFHLPSKRRDLAKELMLMITFVTVIFAMALTRGGFAESVHAFGRSPVGFVFLGFALCITLVFFYLARKSTRPFYTPDISSSSLRALSLFIAFWALLILLVVCLIGLIAPLVRGIVRGGSMPLQGDFFALWCYPFTIAIVALMIGRNVQVRIRTYLYLLAALAGTGVIFVVLGSPTPYPLANFGLPFLLGASASIAFGISREVRQRRASSKVWGWTLIHLSLTVILIGVFVSSAAITESPLKLSALNSTTEVLGATLKLKASTLNLGTGYVYHPQYDVLGPEYSVLESDAEIVASGRVHREALRLYYYPNYGVFSRPLIISTLSRDLYFSMHQTNSSSNSLQRAIVGETIQPRDLIIAAKIIPLVWLVWAGVIMMVIGMVIVLIGECAWADRKNIIH
jgi:cytochrome c-type biogenesis protein CcmF